MWVYKNTGDIILDMLNNAQRIMAPFCDAFVWCISEMDQVPHSVSLQCLWNIEPDHSCHQINKETIYTYSNADDEFEDEENNTGGALNSMPTPQCTSGECSNSFQNSLDNYIIIKPICKYLQIRQFIFMYFFFSLELFVVDVMYKVLCRDLYPVLELL